MERGWAASPRHRPIWWAPGARSGGSPIWSPQTTLDALFSLRLDDAAILDYFVAATQMAWFSVRTRPSTVVSGAHASVTLRQTSS
jgi:hypothetical protein